MKYAASSESFGVGQTIGLIHRCLDPILSEAIEASTLASLDGKLIYVPIIMPAEMHKKYKERSRYVARTSTYECCPHLDHEIFLSGRFEEIVGEYLRGLASAAPHLYRLGATEEQSAEFLTLLEQGKVRALAERREVP